MISKEKKTAIIKSKLIMYIRESTVQQSLKCQS